MAASGTRPPGTVAIGPLLFLGLEWPHPPERFRRATSFPPGDRGVRPLPVPVVVPAGTEATIRVPAALREDVGLAAGAVPAAPVLPSGATGAVVCRAGAAARTYQVSFVVSGPRCVPVTVLAGGRTTTRRVRFGVRSCG